MKNFILSIILCLVSNTLVLGITTYLHFEVIAPMHPEINVFVKAPNTTEYKLYKTYLKGDNKVSTAIDIHSNSLIEIMHGSDRFRLYLQPGDDLNIKYASNSSLSTLDFSGKGSQNNQFLADYEKEFKNGGYQIYEMTYLETIFLNRYFSKIQTHSPSRYFQWLESEKKQQMDFMMFKGKNKDIHAEIYEFIRKDIEYIIETHKLAYLIMKRKNLSTADFNRIADHYKLRKTAASMYGKTMEHPAFRNYLYAYAHFLNLPHISDKPGKEFEYYNKIAKNTTGRAKYFLLSELMQNAYLMDRSYDLARKKFSSFKKECPYQEYVQQVESAYGDFIIDMPERKAPDFIVKDLNGKQVSLSNYRGKVVYVSFWASWCGPCINSFRKSVALRKQLENLGVVLLNVSIDENEMLWKPAVEKVKPYGYNVYASNLLQVKRDYGLSAIPAYFIINKKGDFAYLSDKQNRDILQEFRILVNE